MIFPRVIGRARLRLPGPRGPLGQELGDVLPPVSRYRLFSAAGSLGTLANEATLPVMALRGLYRRGAQLSSAFFLQKNRRGLQKNRRGSIQQPHLIFLGNHI